MKKKRFSVSILIFSLIIVIMAGVGVAESPWDQTDVDPHHNWTIKFNTEMNSDTINDKNIYVKDSNGVHAEVTVMLSEDNESVIIEAPENGYQLGKTHTLHLTNQVKSHKNIPLREVSMVFTVVSSMSEEFSISLIGSAFSDNDHLFTLEDQENFNDEKVIITLPKNSNYTVEDKLYVVDSGVKELVIIYDLTEDDILQLKNNALTKEFLVSSYFDAPIVSNQEREVLLMAKVSNAEMIYANKVILSTKN